MMAYSKLSGRCYDGPMEGKIVETDRSHFPARMPLGGPSIRPIMDALSATVEVHYYRWSYPLRAWVFVWPSAKEHT